MSNQTKLPNKATYALLKAIHHANATAFYLGMVITEAQPKMNTKKFIMDMMRKANSILTDMKLKISDPESKEVLNQELQDPLAIDAITDTYLALNRENRDNFEEYGLFLIDSQKAAEIRRSGGLSDHFDERIAHPKESLLQFISEIDRQRAIMVKQLAIIEKYEPQKLAS